jgi:hypothetical protein
VKDGILHTHTAQIVRIDGVPIRLNRHQQEAVVRR